MRLDKFISYALNLTRSEAKNLIRKGEIKVNGTIVQKSDFNLDLKDDQVYFQEELLSYEEHVYLMMNKPAGFVSSRRDETYPSVLNLISGYEKYKLFIVGRLDADSEGLLLITNDGILSHRLTSPNYLCPKRYYVKVNGEFSDSDKELFQKGMWLKDGRDNDYYTKPAELEIISNNEAYITVIEGKFHQVKRMCAYVGKEVIRLVRTAIGPLELDLELKPGEFRPLKTSEIENLKK